MGHGVGGRGHDFCRCGDSGGRGRERRRVERGIFGNSMGGHGACYLGFRHKDVFGDVELITLVGTQDFFLQANRDLHDLLVRNKVKHTYIEHAAATDAGCSHAPAFVNDFALPVLFEFFDATFNKGEP